MQASGGGGAEEGEKKSVGIKSGWQYTDCGENGLALVLLCSLCSCALVLSCSRALDQPA